MAYSINNPPVKISFGGLTSYGAQEAGSGTGAYGGLNIWLYKSQDAIATVQGAAYFSDGIQRGMMIYDLVYVIDLNLGRGYLCFVSALTPVAAGTNPFAGTQTGSATLNSTTTPLID